MRITKMVKGLCSVAALTVLVLAGPAGAGPLFEADTFSLPDTSSAANQQFQTVTFQQIYDVAPLVFAVATNEGGDPCALRIRNVSKTGFEVIHTEPSNMDGHHAAMTNLAYVAVVPGRWEIEPGVFLEAGTNDTTTTIAGAGGGGGYDTVNLDTAFASAPAIQAHIQTLNSETNTLPGQPSLPWMTTAVRNVAAGSFETSLERAEVLDGGTIQPETIGYVALTQTADTFDGNGGRYTVDGSGSVLFDSLISADSITGWTDQNPDGSGVSVPFNQTFAGAPLVVASMAKRDGGDGGWIRTGAITATDVSLTCDEDTYHDGERGHTDEAASVFAFERAFTAASPTTEIFWDAGSDDVSGAVRPTPDDGSSPYPGTLWGTNTNWRVDNSAQNQPPNDVLPSRLDVVNIALEDNAVQAPAVVQDGDDFEVDSIRVGINPGLGVGGHGRLNITGGELRVRDNSALGATATVASGPQPDRGSLNLGYNGRDGRVTVSGGVLDVEGALNLNVADSGSQGILTVSDGAVLAGELNIGNNGSGDLSTVTQTGGSITVNGTVNFGKTGNKGGTFHIRGGTLNVTGQVKERDAAVDSAQFYIDVPDGDVTIGGDITVQSFRLGQNAGLTGQYTMPAGQRIINTGTMFVGNNGTGELTVNDNVGTVAAPTIEVANSLRVGAGEADTNAGFGTLHFAQGVIDVNGGGMYLAGQDAAGNESNTTGDVVMGTNGGALTGAQLFTRGANLEVGRGGTGTFTQHSGTVTIETNNLILGQAATGDGTYTIHDGKLETLAGQIRVGNTGKGVFLQNGGAVISKNKLDLGNANNPNSDGLYTMNAGTLTMQSNWTIGNAGKGEFQWLGGTINFGNTLLIADSHANSQGTLTIGSPTFAPTLATGQFEVGRTGKGVVNQVDGAVSVAGANNLVISQNASGNATYNMQGGTLTLLSGGNGNINFNAGTGVVDHSGGTVTLAGGNINMTNKASGDATYILRNNSVLNVGGGDISFGPGQVTFDFQGGRLEGLGRYVTRTGDGRVPDEAGNYNGALSAGMGATAPGKVGTAIDFNGTDGYVSFGDVAETNNPGALSVSMWFQRRADGASATNHGINNVLIGQSSNSGNDNFEVGTQGNNVEIYVDSSSGADATVSYTIPSGIANLDWHHIVVTYDQADTDELKLYWDGQLAQTWAQFSGALDVANSGGNHSPLSLGVARPGDQTWGDLDGLIDEFGLWTRALAPGEIAGLYNGGLGAAPGTVTGDPLVELGDVGVFAPTFAQQGGTLAPGESIGTTTLLSNYEVDPAGVLEIEIGGTDGPGVDPTGHDLLAVAGAVDLNDALLLDLLFVNGYQPEEMDTWLILENYGDDPISGTFAGLPEGGMVYVPTSARPLWITYVGGDGNDIELTAVPEPATMALLGLAACGLGGYIRRRRAA